MRCARSLDSFTLEAEQSSSAVTRPFTAVQGASSTSAAASKLEPASARAEARLRSDAGSHGWMRWLGACVWLAACGDAAPGPTGSSAGTGSPTLTAPAAGTSGAAGQSIRAGSAGAAPSGSATAGGAATPGVRPAGSGAQPAAGSAATATAGNAASAGTAGAAGASVATPAAGAGTAGSAATAGVGAAGSAAPTVAILPAIEDPGAAGPFDVRRVVTASGLSSHSLFVPSEVASNGKHPLVVWTCGNGGTVDFYASFLTHLASHGFLVVADKGSSSDRQAEVASQGAAVDWILAENTKQSGEFAGKLDVERIAVMGHSLGSLASFATAAMNTHIRTSIHYSGGLTGNPVGFDEAPLKSMTKPAAFLCGGADSTAGPSCEKDFAQAPPMLPVFYGVLARADHLGPFLGVPRGGDYGTAGVAWLRWQLADDPAYKSWFSGTGCKLCSSPWTAKQRNLD